MPKRPARWVVTLLALCCPAAVGAGIADGATPKPVKLKGGLYAGKASVPHAPPFAKQFQFKVDGGKRRVFNILKSPCVSSQGLIYSPGSGSARADVPKKHPRYGSKVSRSGKISARIKFRDRYPKEFGQYDQTLDFSYRITGKFTSSKRAKGHLSVTVKATTVYPGTTTQVLENGQPTPRDTTCRTGRVSWKVKR